MTHSTAYKTALGLPMLPPLAAVSLGKSADHMAQLIGFHSLYNVPMAPMGSEDKAFRHMDDARVALRLGLIVEELKELFADGFGIRLDIQYVIPEDLDGPDEVIDDLARALRVSDHRDGAEVADASGDLVYVLYGMMLEMGYDLRAVIQEIHGSNMTKLGEDGKPVYRDDGKVLKGPNYMKPNIPAALGWED
jgi:predicted HAD superfamily Cof-like phosphohydrolase